MVRTSCHGEQLARLSRRGIRRKPSSRIFRAWPVTRVATTTSKPSRKAARAIERRCDQKYQSSVIRKRILRRLNEDSPAPTARFQFSFVGQFPPDKRRELVRGLGRSLNFGHVRFGGGTIHE